MTIRHDDPSPLPGGAWTQGKVITMATVGVVLVVMVAGVMGGVTLYIRRQKVKIESIVLGSLKGESSYWLNS